MGFQNVVVLLFLAFAFIIDESKCESVTESEQLIRKELDRFASIQDALEKANLNVTVVFSRHLKDTEDDTPMGQQKVAFRPISSKYTPSGPQSPDKINEDDLEKIYQFAKLLNMSAVASRETFLEDGTLDTRVVYAKDIKMSYEGGNSHIVISDMEEGFEGFVAMLKLFAVPVEVDKTLYNEEGVIIKSDITHYKPSKVKIIAVKGMPGYRQLSVAETVKTIYAQESTPEKRVDVICRSLSFLLPSFSWNAALGDAGYESVTATEWIQLSFEGETYTIWGLEKDTE